MISLRELNPDRTVPTPEQRENLRKLHAAMNVLRKEFGHPMVVTSGLRSWEKHEALYKKLEKRAPTKSAHLEGLACDISDRTGELWEFCLHNFPLLEKLGLYLENRTATPTWVHFQLRRPGSGYRIFSP